MSNKGEAGLALIMGLAVALWSASSYVGAFMRASNQIYEVEEGRQFWKLRPLQMLVTLVMVLLLTIVAIAIVATGPLADAIGNQIGLGGAAVTAWEIAKWPVLLAVVMLMFALLYYAAPNVRQPGIRWVTPWRRAGGGPLDSRLGGVRVLRGQLRFVQQGIWITRRRRRIPRVDLGSLTSPCCSAPSSTRSWSAGESWRAGTEGRSSRSSWSPALRQGARDEVFFHTDGNSGGTAGRLRR